VAKAYRSRAKLYVEGRDDVYSIANLLKAHQFQVEVAPRDLEIQAAGDRGKLLGLIETAVKASTNMAIAFVVDADASATGTWTSIRHHVEQAVGGGFKLPAKCPHEGLAVDVPSLKSRVGAWIMPDNSNVGMLESFLQQLVHDADPLLPLAKSSTAQAKGAGALFRDVAEPKAIIHTWLAWQADPGCPFGTAIKAKYFDHAAPMAQKFINWVRRLVD
jgi:hypothetical protein